MRIDSCGASHLGKVRSHNEDNIYVRGSFRQDVSKGTTLIRGNGTKGPYTFGVFDGLGGEASGEQASLIAALGLKVMDKRGSTIDVDTYISTTHKAILKEAGYKDAHNMGTTVVALQLEGSRAAVFNVGDSRAYLYREGRLSQLSRDHSVIQSMIDNGFSEAAERHKENYSGELTQYIGMPSDEGIEPEAYVHNFTLQEGDIVLLCSDGLTSELTDDEIRSVMEKERSGSAEHIVANLIKSALDRTCKDNISVVVCRIEQE